MDDPALSVFSEARHEYMKQLSQYLRTPFMNFFMTQMTVAKEDTRDNPKKYLWQFQNQLRSIKDWNIEKMKNEIKAIEIASNCDFLEELITAVFIAHTKVMTAIRVSSRKNKINITVPKLEHYLFKALCECSDLLWANTYLFRDDLSAIEKQKNMRQVEQLVLEGMQQAIRALLPVKSILRDLVPDEDEHDDIEETEASNTLDSIVETPEINNEKVESSNVINEGQANDTIHVTETSDGTRHFEQNASVPASVPVPADTHASKGVVVNKLSNDSLLSETTTPLSNLNDVAVNKMSAQDSGILEKAENILLTADPLEELTETSDIPFVSGPIEESVKSEPINALVEGPLVLQVDTSKKVQFSDYNMGIAHDEDGFIEPMGEEDLGNILMDDTEQAISDDDFETL